MVFASQSKWEGVGAKYSVYSSNNRSTTTLDDPSPTPHSDRQAPAACDLPREKHATARSFVINPSWLCLLLLPQSCLMSNESKTRGNGCQQMSKVIATKRRVNATPAPPQSTPRFASSLAVFCSPFIDNRPAAMPARVTSQLDSLSCDLEPARVSPQL